MHVLARVLDEPRHWPDGRQRNIAPGELERFDEALVRGKPQILIGQECHRFAMAVVGRIERDAFERALGISAGGD
jgi:hypothetical protein